HEAKRVNLSIRRHDATHESVRIAGGRAVEVAHEVDVLLGIVAHALWSGQTSNHRDPWHGIARASNAVRGSVTVGTRAGRQNGRQRAEQVNDGSPHRFLR